MAQVHSGSFVIEVTGNRALSTSEVKRTLARLPGVSAVSVTDPYADDAADRDFGDPERHVLPEDPEDEDTED
jgi:hypothetical protein